MRVLTGLKRRDGAEGVKIVAMNEPSFFYIIFSSNLLLYSISVSCILFFSFISIHSSFSIHSYHLLIFLSILHPHHFLSLQGSDRIKRVQYIITVTLLTPSAPPRFLTPSLPSR